MNHIYAFPSAAEALLRDARQKHGTVPASAFTSSTAASERPPLQPADTNTNRVALLPSQPAPGAASAAAAGPAASSVAVPAAQPAKGKRAAPQTAQPAGGALLLPASAFSGAAGPLATPTKAGPPRSDGGVLATPVHDRRPADGVPATPGSVIPATPEDGGSGLRRVEAFGLAEVIPDTPLDDAKAGACSRTLVDHCCLL